MAILISDKVDYKTSITRNKEGHFMIKESIQQEDKTVLNLYVPTTQFQICKVKDCRIKRINRETHNYSQRFNAILPVLEQTDKKEKNLEDLK